MTREEAIKWFKENPFYHNDHEPFKMAIKALEQEQKAVRHGRWIDGKRMGFDGTYHWFRQCAECLHEREDDTQEKDTNYCPNCYTPMIYRFNHCPKCGQILKWE